MSTDATRVAGPAPAARGAPGGSPPLRPPSILAASWLIAAVGMVGLAAALSALLGAAGMSLGLIGEAGFAGEGALAMAGLAGSGSLLRLAFAVEIGRGRDWARGVYLRLVPLETLVWLALGLPLGLLLAVNLASWIAVAVLLHRPAASTWFDRCRQDDPVSRVWQDPRLRAVIDQALLVLAVILAGWYLYSNLAANMARQNIATGFGFLDREAGFAIAEGLIPYDASDTYGRALIVGFLNTIRVAVLGIVLATIIGVIVGIARLSTNWLVAKIASAYVEAVRNVPLLLQLFLWYAVITESLPRPAQAIEPVSGIFLSNRGIMMPVPVSDPVHLFMGIALLAGIAGTWALKRWAARRQAATGEQFPVLWGAAGLILGLPMLVWLVGGAPTALDVPALQGFNFRGGVTLSPEFAAVLFGLSFYTAGFIAEIVRSGILAVSYGQTEAAAALGLRRGLVLRLVVLPQAVRIVIPPTTSQYLNLTKNSSLAVAVGYPDLVSIGNTTLNQTGQAIEAISIYMAVYLILSLLISAFMNWYNRHVALVER